MVIIGGIIGTIILLLCVMYCVIQHFQNRDLKRQYIHTINELTESNEQKILGTSALFDMVERLSGEKLVLKERVLKLENAIESGFGVTVRKDITLVNTNLLKMDFVIILAGIHKLLKANPENIEDVKYYIDLIERVQVILNKMPEIQEEKGASEIIDGTI